MTIESVTKSCTQMRHEVISLLGTIEKDIEIIDDPDLLPTSTDGAIALVDLRFQFLKLKYQVLESLSELDQITPPSGEE